MKKSILTLAVSVFVTSALLAGCSSPAEKVVDAQSDVAQANQNLDKANDAYLADMDKYRKETTDRINANKKSIADFRARVAEDKAATRAEYYKKLDDLEQKNTDMQKSLDDYKADGKDKWEAFKKDFSNGLDGVGNSFKDLTGKKK